MKEGFRQSMSWLHTWGGLITGWILFFVFLVALVISVIMHLVRRA